ncbi:hypothetical protein Tco_0011310 [Tanacetum coccineum]
MISRLDQIQRQCHCVYQPPQPQLPAPNNNDYTTTTLPLPPQPQQGSSDSILIKRMGELEQHIADLVEENQALETRLDKQGNRIHKLENIDWPKNDQRAYVKHANESSSSCLVQDLPKSDMKEILLQRMLEENYDKGHANHRVAYEALQDSIRRDEVEDFDVDKAQEETKKKSASGASGTTGASDSAQAPPSPLLHPHLIIRRSATTPAAPSSSKTAASAEYSAWTTTDTRVKPSITTIPDDLYMDDETTADEQAYSSGDEVTTTASHIHWEVNQAQCNLQPGLLLQLRPGVLRLVRKSLISSWIEEKCKYDIAAITWLSEHPTPCEEYFQAGIDSLPEQLNLTKPRMGGN